MAIKVYGMSTYNCQRVSLALLEFGVEDFDLTLVDLKAREHFSPEYLAMQPFHQVPVFESGDFRLYESRAIVRYIAEKYKDAGPNILGSTLEEKALVNQWVDVEAHQFNDFAFAPWSMEYYLSWMMKRPLNEALVAPLYEKLGYFLDVAEKHLSKTKYLAGNFFSMVDLNIAPSLLRVSVLQPELINDRKNVKQWYESITSRPAFKKMLEVDEGWRFPYGPFTNEEAQKLRTS
ncbi:hypothetical protein KC19_9G126600 [Ceratodon purpureus]|uniref:glutathione transferase n=1 Tax=Ceratodon purpureus TaxID=3225 RepID=A0A8T0GV29_CERPU|nr:hypothetical protein KC19_9G126600 [Ceratodon purpureus]